MSVQSCDWLPVQNVSRPPTVAISVVFNGFLAELAAHGLGVESVIVSVKAAVVAVANAATGTLSIAAVSSAAASILGVLEVVSVTINGLATDATAPTFWTAEQFVGVTVPVIA